jgi:signal transduction histidine kinase
MKIRTKTIVVIFLASLFVFGVMQVATIFVIQPSFKNLETLECEEGVAQALSTIDYRLSQLTGKVKDYSFWDDTYNFVQYRNVEYIENNYVDSTFENLNLNLVAIVDSNGSLVYCQSFDSNNSVKVETLEQTKDYLATDDLIWDLRSGKETFSGLMFVDKQPMFAATAPILTSLEQGPTVGGLLFGSYIDEKEISQIEEITNLNFSLYTLSEFRIQKSDSGIVDSLLSSKPTVVVKENGPDTVSGFTLIDDIHSNSLFVLQITQNRVAYQQGLWVMNSIQVAGIAFIVSFGLGILFLLEKNIVKPMTQLAAYVREMPFSHNSDPKISINSEEVAVLADAVRDTMKKKLEGMNEVSRMVGHDLRNPLTGIKGASYVLKKNYGSKLDEKGNAMLKTIDDCVAYSDKIVRDLLEYSCEIKLDRIETTPQRLVNDSLLTLVVPGNIDVINETTDEFSILVDNGKIERVFTNLIRNAFDAMPYGGKLKITNRKANNMVEIDFSDNGKGMSEAVLKKLWTPFFTTKAQGMGIGLSICKRIIDAHGGRIEVKSTLGEGTTFAISFPIPIK